MKSNKYRELEKYMLLKMSDSAHDRLHVYRVLYLALDIASREPGADMDVLIAAALLHDIGRAAQLLDLNLDHAEIGAAEAYEFLNTHGWEEKSAAHVRDCISTHRYRHNKQPATIEAKILFDADKLDVSGAMGIARTLLYVGQIDEPLYNIRNGELVTDGAHVEAQAFLEEYNFKLRNIYGAFHTARAAEIADSRRPAAEAFYDAFVREIEDSRVDGQKLLEEFLEEA